MIRALAPLVGGAALFYVTVRFQGWRIDRHQAPLHNAGGEDA